MLLVASSGFLKGREASCGFQKLHSEAHRDRWGACVCVSLSLGFRKPPVGEAVRHLQTMKSLVAKPTDNMGPRTYSITVP